jgi:hypothetical protein
LAETPQTDPLAALVDVPLPTSVSLWPQTWTSRVALALILAAVVGGGWALVRRWRARRYRRAALAELAAIERRLSVVPSATVSTELAALVRRTALAGFPRDQVAGLNGAAWLSFLDRTSGSHDFSDGAGRTLELAAYQPTASEPRLLIGLVRHWIEVHHA